MDVSINSGLAELSNHYDAAILDSWGVLHNGVEPYPDVLEFLNQARLAGWKIIVLSNAPRIGNSVSDQIEDFGIPKNLYDDIITSGDLTRHALADKNDSFHSSLGKNFFHLGPVRDHGLLDGLNFIRVKKLNDCDFLLNTGLYDDEKETESDYFDFLIQAKSLEIPMICSNPDIEVNRGGKKIPCAGLIAKSYESLGGKVVYHGKPSKVAYEACLSKLHGITRSQVVVVGDSIATDILGASNAGLDSILVAGGIHADELGYNTQMKINEEKLKLLLSQHNVEIVAAVGRLRW